MPKDPDSRPLYGLLGIVVPEEPEYGPDELKLPGQTGTALDGKDCPIAGVFDPGTPPEEKPEPTDAAGGALGSGGEGKLGRGPKVSVDGAVVLCSSVVCAQAME